MKTPLLLVGDGPHEATGLGRILRDLGRRIVTSDLPVELASVGGPMLPYWREWPVFPMGEAERMDDWGAGYTSIVWRSVFGKQPGILWVIWDPSRLFAYQTIDAPVRLWSYPAVDAPNRVGTIGGPAGAAVAAADRVIGYGEWGANILRTLRDQPVNYLPHGITPEDWGLRLLVHEERAGWADAELGPYVRQDDIVIGCVATNQPRKDLSLFFGALAELASRGHKVYGWLHTDTLVKAWSIPQLIEDCGLHRRVSLTMKPYSDHELAALYRRCAVTVAPGLGEGFGYPIVESLAAGTPVVHVDFAGGRELVPKVEWRFPVREVRLEGVYAVQRPVCRAEDVANAIERVLQWKIAVGPAEAAGYCQGSVEHLNWDHLWPRWYKWIKSGL